MALHAAQHRADAQRHVAQTDGAGAQAQLARGHQDLHHHGRVVAELPAADHPGQRGQQRVVAHEAQPHLHLLHEALAAALHLLGHRHATQHQGRGHQQQRVQHQRQRRSERLDEHAAQRRPGHLGAAGGQRVLGVRLHQAFARHHLRQHHLGGGTRHGVHAAQHEGHQVEPLHAERAQPMRDGHAQQRRRQRQLARHVDRQLAHAVQPHAAGQRQQREGQQFERRQVAHLLRTGVEQQRGGQRQRQQGDLRAGRGHQDRGPEPAVGAVAQQVVGAEGEALAQRLECGPCGHGMQPVQGDSTGKAARTARHPALGCSGLRWRRAAWSSWRDANGAARVAAIRHAHRCGAPSAAPLHPGGAHRPNAVQCGAARCGAGRTRAGTRFAHRFPIQCTPRSLPWPRPPTTRSSSCSAPS